MTRIGTILLLTVLSASRGTTADDAWDQATHPDGNLSGQNTLSRSSRLRASPSTPP